MRFRWAMLAGLWAAAFFPRLAPAEKPAVRIGYLADGPHYFARAAWDSFRRELALIAGDRFDISYPEKRQIVGRWERAEIAAAGRELLSAPDVDLIVGMGLDSSAFFARETALAKPVVLFGDMDIELAGLPDRDGRSPVPNLTFQVQRGKILRELARVKQLARGAPITVLLDPGVREAIPDLEANARKFSEAAGLSFRLAETAETAAATAAALPPDTAFVYLAPSDRFNTEEKIAELLGRLNERQIPTFAMEGVPVVELGALAGLYRNSPEKIARNNALKVYEIIQGGKPEEQSVFFEDAEEFTLNLSTAARIGYDPSFDLLLEARQIGGEEESGARFDPREAVRTALENNLEYQIARRQAEEAEADFKKSRAALLPQLSLSASYQRVDDDQAESSMGMLPRWQSQAGVKVEQLIFDFATWKEVSIARQAVVRAEAELRRQELDTAEAALLAYLDVLRARELFRIQKENLQTTLNHLETARVRRAQEAGSREDVLRWESEYKSALSDLIAAEISVRKAGLAFNQVLNRPQEEKFRLAPLAGAEGGAETAFFDEKLDAFLGNWRQTDLFREFLVEKARDLSPDVATARVTAAIAEEDRERAKAGLWSPTVGASFDYTRRLGDETAEPDVPAEMESLFSGDPSDNEWTLSAYASLPLWTGGSRWADLGQKNAALLRARQALELQEESTGLAVRTAFLDVAASTTTLDLDRERERLTRERLAIVEDKYRGGSLPILDLLDAQSNAVSAQAAAVSSFYASFADLVRLERQVGFIEFLQTPAETESFIGAAQAYVEKNGPRTGAAGPRGEVTE